MKDIADEIRNIVDQALGQLTLMKPDQVSSKETPDSWSKKEVIGHLIDSAANNHQRFVRACSNEATTFPTYQQEDWVRIQQYNESDWGTLVALWSAYNRHLSDVIERIPQDAMSSGCNIGQENPATLEFVVRDYLQHLRHHMHTILDKQT
ncbi:MAG: DinB family protein [Chloroflexi bacterium]|nr:DinB family protein [Chloroflexota bacterium]